MSMHRTPRVTGQRNLARYRHTRSCIRSADQRPGKERDDQKIRCRILLIMTLLLLLPGVMAIFV